jgi:murein DD-endopeptidase MepM/ murein hydrolase activator NlpD
VLRLFEEPPSPFEAGHRGIDIAAPFGTVVVASAKGTVSFAGFVAGSLFVTIQHVDGVRTTYSWLSQVSVKTGDQLAAQQPIGWSGHGHPEVSTPHLHFGVRVDDTYVDPMTYLRPGDVVDLIRLAPLEDDHEP